MLGCPKSVWGYSVHFAKFPKLRFQTATLPTHTASVVLCGDICNLYKIFSPGFFLFVCFLRGDTFYFKKATPTVTILFQ